MTFLKLHVFDDIQVHIIRNYLKNGIDANAVHLQFILHIPKLHLMVPLKKWLHSNNSYYT